MKMIDSRMNLAEAIEELAEAFEASFDADAHFDEIRWTNRMVVARGETRGKKFQVHVSFIGSPVRVASTCSLCSESIACSHVGTLFIVMFDSGIAHDIEANGFSATTYTLKENSKPKTPSWQSQIATLASQYQYAWPHEPARSKFPNSRELIYVIDWTRYNMDDDVMAISLATRPNEHISKIGDQNKVHTSLPKKTQSNLYRKFTGGIDAWMQSPHELDRELATRAGTLTNQYGYNAGYDFKFHLKIDRSADTIARLARSGRLYGNYEYRLHDEIELLSCLDDEPFDLKFEVASLDAKRVKLGLRITNPNQSIRPDQLKTVYPRYFLDDQNRLGLFRQPINPNLIDNFKSPQSTIAARREEAAELIAGVMSIPIGLGIDFVGCEDIAPSRLTLRPRPRFHVKAPSALATKLEAEVQFDYDGIQVPILHPATEFYDRSKNALIQIDRAAHESSYDLLASLGVKREGQNKSQFKLPAKKLPQIVAHLIHAGWHVEADGKLYRTGSKFDIKISSGIDWFELNGKAHFENVSIDLPRLLQSLKSGQKSVVLDDGTVGLIPEDWIRQFGRLADLGTHEEGAIRFGKCQVGLLDVMLAEQGEVDIDKKFDEARRSLRAFDRIEPHEAPRGFVGELRPYQKLAQGWFEFLRNLGLGGCLADDMGLGKTIQVLAMLESRRCKKAGPSLIVVPRSLIFNWMAEAKKFAPKLRVLDQSHAARSRGTTHLTEYDLVLTTYGTLRRDAAFLKDFEFDYVILDEAQAIKNASTEAAKAARLLKGRNKLAMSGTPIENHLGELWSLFDFLNPGMLGRVGRFADFAHDAQADERKLLAAAVRPFILRRTKKQVAPELPDRVEQTVIVELDEAQRRAYDELRDHYRAALLEKIKNDGIGRSQIIILEALLRLRQAACHPGLIDPARIDEPSAKLDELLDRLTTAVESGERVLVFSQFTSLLAIAKKRLADAKIDYLYLDGKTRDRQSLVNQFQSGSGPSVFLISLKAGGVGLNLTAARTVFLLDPWWNPAVEAQAIDRVHRIGQHQTVFATRLIAADTVEQKVLELQARKKDLADAIVNADNAGIHSLTREDVELLLT